MSRPLPKVIISAGKYKASAKERSPENDFVTCDFSKVISMQ